MSVEILPATQSLPPMTISVDDIPDAATFPQTAAERSQQDKSHDVLNGMLRTIHACTCCRGCAAEAKPPSEEQVQYQRA